MPEKTISMDSIACKKAIRCTTPSCGCECFLPAKSSLRLCDTCKHGWVAHALDKLGYRHVFNAGLQVEIVQPNIVFDIASLMLYGAQATPIRLKILLDRLFSVLQHEEVLQVLHGFGWTYEDYARGYILQVQETSGRVLDKWICATRDEEFVIMQQFLRFGETKSIAQEIILQDTKERQDIFLKQTTHNDSEIKKFIDRSNLSMQNLIRPFDVRHLFGARLPYLSPTGSRLLSPPLGFSTPTSSSRDLRPPLISVSSTSPVTTSPLGRLQTMQPFDYRRESVSPSALSPGEKPSSRASPKSESPQNLSKNPASAQSTPPHTPFTPVKHENEPHMSHISLPQTLHLGGPALILPALQRHGPPDDGVINFSLKEDQDSQSYYDRKNKHLRKSSNPIKRNWMPDPSFGASMIGPNGKKRVLCTACNKSFCDKGALKIHYSAVHLKEMHKCSVEGCTMMFSSRRSRNRHSANPNPKLHMPQKRPKIPEGARLVDDGTGASAKRQLSSPPSVFMSNSMMSQSPGSMVECPSQRPFYADPNITMPVFPTAAKRLKLDGLDDGPKDLSLPIMRSGQSSRETSPGNASLSLVPDHVLDEYQNAVKGSLDDSQDSDSSNTQATGSPGQPRLHNRRKNIPTRLAQPYREPNGCNEESLTSRENVDGNEHENLKNGSDVAKLEVDNECSDIDDRSLDKSDGKLVINDDEDDSCNEDDEEDDDMDTGEVLDFAMHMPEGLDGENMSGPDSNDASHDSNEDSSDNSKHGESLSDVEIPLDKENPKQCISCGKAFLNIFGLKIHYKNVHLKLMHKCTVEGCSASFPSKRSRDRHSSNLNLHRKLLLTAEDQNSASGETDDNQNFRADVIQKLYEQNMSSDDDNAEPTDLSQPVVNGKFTNDKAIHDTDHDNCVNENKTNESNSDFLGSAEHQNGTQEEPSEDMDLPKNNNSKSLVDKVSPNTRKSRRQVGQGDIRKTTVGDKAVSV
ncbi:zinc finger protein basonuclin-2-like isoform X1 [Mya arenaria]|uniref:zinc finger protein basonuclin-2-like isoform X1 n=1 Tax=Mya arenaria TaxID=6604 RepID=UPI0022DEBDE4|nr:zinc finger protein basonuclin-2-like isoform X1 [Mya arenaria]